MPADANCSGMRNAKMVPATTRRMPPAINHRFSLPARIAGWLRKLVGSYSVGSVIVPTLGAPTPLSTPLDRSAGAVLSSYGRGAGALVESKCCATKRIPPDEFAELARSSIH